MKKEIVLGLIVFLVAITLFSVLRESDVKSVASNLEDENEKLMKQIEQAELELTEKTNELQVFSEENQELTDNLTALNQEITLLKTSTEYQDFRDAIHTVESYKSARTFNDAKEYITRGVAYSSADSKGNCPCGFLLSETHSTFEWNPNVVQELVQFRIEGDQIFLTYSTTEDNYQFELIKEQEETAQDLKWRIRAITTQN